MNLGIALSTPGHAASITDVYAAYMDMQVMTDEMNDDLHQISALSETMSNIRDIARTIKTHHSSEALAAIQNLFEDKGVTSFETLKEKARAVWNKIMSLFNAIGEKMRSVYAKYRSKFISALQAHSKQLIDKIQKLPTDNIEFQYKGIRLTDRQASMVYNQAEYAVYTDDEFEKVGLFSEVKPKLEKIFDEGTWTVSTKATVIDVLKKVDSLLGLADEYYSLAWRRYYKSRENMRKAYSDNDVETAKKCLDNETNHLKAFLFITRRYFWTSNSIIANARQAYARASSGDSKKE